jgi:single-strand DNA-binding protein
MLNDAQVSLTGYVATQPFTRTVKTTGAMNCTMRVAWTPRRQDRVTGEWVDGNTSYVTVICWRKLATNVAICVRKGDPVVVKGRLSVRPYDDKEGVPRLAVEVDASSVGHDLSRGVASFQRVRPQTGLSASEYEASRAGGEQASDEASGDRRLDPAGGQLATSAGEGEEAAPGGSGPDAGSWAGGGDSDIPLPEEPADSFFDEAAVSSVISEPAAAV